MDNIGYLSNFWEMMQTGKSLENKFSLSENRKQFAGFLYVLSVDNSITYRHFESQVHNLSANLMAGGIRKNQRVAILAENAPEGIALFWALWQIGAIAAPLNVRFPQKQLQALLQNCGCRHLILAKSFEHLRFSGISTFPLEKLFLENDDVARGDEVKIRKNFIPFDQSATIIFTSGSTGEPAAALHRFGNHYFSALGSNQNISFGPGDRWLLALPLYHVGGLAILFRAYLSGGTVVLPDKHTSLSKTIEQTGVTHVSLVATQFYRLLKEPEGQRALSKLKAILLGGSAIPGSLIDAAIALKLPIYTSYGSTEMASQITTTPPDASAETLRTSGQLLPFRELKIAPDGEILVRGKTLFAGYWQDGQLRRRRDAGGWFATGDLGRLDADGYLQVLGRKDNQFISGGENIQPEEIEKILNRHPDVVQSMVVPVQNDEFGMRPAAFVEMKNGCILNGEQLRTYLAGRLASYKIPRFFLNWPDKPLQNNIKLNRKFFQWLAVENNKLE